MGSACSMRAEAAGAARTPMRSSAAAAGAAGTFRRGRAEADRNTSRLSSAGAAVGRRFPQTGNRCRLTRPSTPKPPGTILNKLTPSVFTRFGMPYYLSGYPANMRRYFPGNSPEKMCISENIKNKIKIFYEI